MGVCVCWSVWACVCVVAGGGGGGSNVYMHCNTMSSRTASMYWNVYQHLDWMLIHIVCVLCVCGGGSNVYMHCNTMSSRTASMYWNEYQHLD